MKLGLADRVGTLDDALAKHGATRPVGMRGGLFSAPFLADEDRRRKDPEDGENVDDQDHNEMSEEDGDNTCECACSACKEGACDACSCNACACDQTTSAHKKAAANRRRLQLAEL